MTENDFVFYKGKFHWFIQSFLLKHDGGGCHSFHLNQCR